MSQDLKVLSAFHGSRHDHARCVDGALAAAERLCRSRNLRLTALRRRVLELVWSSHGPVKAYELLERLGEERGRVAPPTVYRALDFLLAEGLIHRLESLSAYVGCGDPRHAHQGQFLICRQCHTVAELDDPELNQVLLATASGLGFAADQTTVELSGLCARCGDGR
ncbi:Fur family transcriptional regulator [Alkalilimnicola sp. S0819]|uniref:Fur family transcriptional regulator n=1 Tax=Alkalilimnicola sp. S0819 TaxID=2613922 RepID=UPI001262576D|nr:Fur family transcriptional regulator [Alkalilimnicola sp. S0819]KAB7627218.1 transcriptional repressor [Alkalilimnicola sp. S0819]MPQ15931.1 transcriptional repressor [Alkalilimnicola sp. S0819]